MIDLEDVREMDRNDPLRVKRSDFTLPEDTVYLDGNSLGALPASVPEHIANVVSNQWGRDLITSWNTHAWIDLPVATGEKIAPLLGAAPGQVIVCDSISVNLFKLLACSLTLRPSRNTILAMDGDFPTDQYMAQGLATLLGTRRCRLRTADQQDLSGALDETTAVLMLTHVNFRDGSYHDMQQMTQRAHEAGALVIWDLAHSAGAMPLNLDACNADFAVGCGYKFLNGGPGAPAFIYVARRLQEQISQPLTGWMGHVAPFAFDATYTPAPGMAKFLAGTPSILACSALCEALRVFEGVDLQTIRSKSIALGTLCDQLVRQDESLNDLVLASPEEADQRASQICYRHSRAYEICQALIKSGVITDFRAPDILRIGLTPLYTRYEDVWILTNKLKEIIETRDYESPEFAIRAKVT
jgi:kynureninase